MTREKEKVVHGQSVSLEKEHEEGGRHIMCSIALGVGPQAHKWIFIEKAYRKSGTEGKGPLWTAAVGRLLHQPSTHHGCDVVVKIGEVG